MYLQYGFIFDTDYTQICSAVTGEGMLTSVLICTDFQIHSSTVSANKQKPCIKETGYRDIF